MRIEVQKERLRVIWMQFVKEVKKYLCTGGKAEVRTLISFRCCYLQEELHPVPQVVREDVSVKGLDTFFTEPALTASVILRQLLKVRPARHLNRKERQKIFVFSNHQIIWMFLLSLYIQS